MYEQLLYESQPDEEDFADELTRYIYSNHLQSASLELDEQAEIISYEEYHPYGTTSYQAMNALIKATAKRYRLAGKERDEESGLYYHGAGYYIPWLCRWSAVDALESKYAGMIPYNYGNCNPITFNDPSGMVGELVLKDNVVTVNATFVFYGSQTTSSNPELKEERQKAISDRIKKIQSSLNESGLKMEGPKGVTNNQNETSFDLKFNFKVQVLSEYDAYKKMVGNIGDDFDPNLVFVRLEDDFTDGVLSAQVSTTGSLYITHKDFGNNFTSGDNSMYIQIKQFNTTTFLHELFAHVFSSRDTSAHIGTVDEKTTEFSIRTHKFTKGVDDKYQESYFDPGKGEDVKVLKESLRKVLQSDIDLIKVYGDLKKQDDGTWKAWISGATNTFFKKTPILKQTFESGGKYYAPKQFNVHDKKILLKKYLKQINFYNAIFYVIILIISLSKQQVFAQKKDLPSIFSNSDHYYYYRVDTIKQNDKVFELPNHYEDTSFLIYSLVKLWHEDDCGHKGYKVNIAKFLAQKLKDDHLILYKKDIIYHFGIPFDSSEYRYNGLLEENDSLGIYVPELDEDFILLKYPIVKSRDCKSVKEFITFNIDRKSNKVYSINFVSDFFDKTELDVD